MSINLDQGIIKILFNIYIYIFYLKKKNRVISSRMAGFLAGFPETTSLMAVNRLCSSGLEACSIIASKIRSGTIDIGIGSGVE